MCNVFNVAKKICESNDWEITNLQLQKILYIMQVFSLGERDKPIFNAKIEAGNYGPVVSEVYHRFKYLGIMPIPSYEFIDDTNDYNDDECRFISKMIEMTKGLKGWELVAITHRKGSAWTKTFKPGIEFLEISEKDMKNEYTNLWKNKKEK